MATTESDTTTTERKDAYHLRRADVGDLAQEDRIQAIFIRACAEGPSPALRRDLRVVLPTVGFDRHAPSDDDLDAVLHQGAGYMAAAVRTRHQDLQRVEDRIATLETALGEYRDVRDDLASEYDHLSRETGVTADSDDSEEGR